MRSLELMLLLEKINELGTTVLVVTHEKELVDAFFQACHLDRHRKSRQRRIGRVLRI